MFYTLGQEETIAMFRMALFLEQPVSESELADDSVPCSFAEGGGADSHSAYKVSERTRKFAKLNNLETRLILPRIFEADDPTTLSVSVIYVNM